MLISHQAKNRMAQSISIENQRSKWINRGRIARYFLLQKKKKNQVYLADKTFQFDMDTVKGVVYFNDITQNQLLKLHQTNSQPVIGILSIDNYADAIDKLDDKEISYLNSFVTTLVSDWMNEYHVFFKRINAERFFFVAQMIDLKKMMDKNLICWIAFEQKLKNRARLSPLVWGLLMAQEPSMKSVEKLRII